MPEGVGYGPQNTASVSDKSFNVIGNHLYGLNGGVDTGGQGVETTVFEATTGNYYVVATARFAINSSSGDDIEFIMYFNGVAMFGEYAQSGTTESDSYPINIIIPPLTEVKITANNKGSSTGRGIFTIITGRIYK